VLDARLPLRERRINVQPVARRVAGLGEDAVAYRCRSACATPPFESVCLCAELPDQRRLFSGLKVKQFQSLSRNVRPNLP